MGLRRRKVVEPLRSGRFRLNLEAEERTMLARLLDELRDVLLRADPSDVRLRRLFPTAYHSDPEADAEYQRLMREELVASRMGMVDTVQAALQATEMSEEELYALMQGLNALRLVLGTLLDVSEDDERTSQSPDDPLAAEAHLYDYLSWLLEMVVRALSGAL